MPAFTHFSIWDNELRVLLNEIDANDTISYLSKEIREWLYWDGCLIYTENETKSLHSEASAFLKSKGRFADMSEQSMTGHMMLALDAFGTTFCEYFKHESNEEANKILKAIFDRFILLALRNHKLFIQKRALVTNQLELQKLEVQKDTNEKKGYKTFTVFIIQELENIKKELSKTDKDENFALISDINQFIDYRKEFERFEFNVSATPRLSRSPHLSSKSITALSSSGSSKPLTGTESPILPKKASQGLMARFSRLKIFDTDAANKKEAPPPNNDKYLLKLN
jgi:hypothetical protein